MAIDVELHQTGVLIKRLLLAHARKRKVNRPRRKWFDIARRKQLPPAGDDWSVWAILAGRGFGKSRAGGEWMVTNIEENPGAYAIIAPTFRDVRQFPIAAFMQALKDAGYKEEEDYRYNKSEILFSFPNGSKVMGYSAEKPNRIRGSNLSGAWCDELAFFPKLESLWKEALRPAIRIGARPRILITTTPRPIPFLKTLIERPTTKLVQGSTFENAANLSEASLEELVVDYEGTRVGRQELYGELLDESELALWNRRLIEAVQWLGPVPSLVRTIVSVDPSGSAEGDATGIVVVGIDADGVIYILEDCTTKGSPEARYEEACLAAFRWGVGTILYEGAYGGDNIAHGLRSTWDHLSRAGRVDSPLPSLKVSPTKSSKADRAHPVVALYEQTSKGIPRVRHVRGLAKMEDEMVQWESSAKWSPNRMDAMVHGIRFLSQTIYRPTTVVGYDNLPSLPSLPIS